MCELLDRGLVYGFYLALNPLEVLDGSLGETGRGMAFEAAETAALVECLDFVLFVKVLSGGEALELDAKFSLEVHHLK
jgi:hypothetical protein